MRFRDDQELFHHRWILKVTPSGKVWPATPDREIWKTDLQVGDKYAHLIPFSGQRMPSHLRRAQAYIDRVSELGWFAEQEFQDLVDTCEPKKKAAGAAHGRAAAPESEDELAFGRRAGRREAEPGRRRAADDTDEGDL